MQLSSSRWAQVLSDALAMLFTSRTCHSDCLSLQQAECPVISIALMCNQPSRVPKSTLPGYTEGSKPVILLYFLWRRLLWHNASVFTLKGLLVILSDLICGSSCWDGHWRIVSGTRLYSSMSTTLTSKIRAFCSSQSWSSLSVWHSFEG